MSVFVVHGLSSIFLESPWGTLLLIFWVIWVKFLGRADCVPVLLSEFFKSWGFLIVFFLISGSLLAGSRSSSPGKLLGSTYGGLSSGTSRVQPVPSSSEKRSKIPRSQGCSRETSPSRIGLGKNSHCSDMLTSTLEGGTYLLIRKLCYSHSSEFFSCQINVIVVCRRVILIF